MACFARRLAAANFFHLAFCRFVSKLAPDFRHCIWPDSVPGLFLGAILACEDKDMSKTSLPQSHEQRKIEKLLLKLAKMKPKHETPAPIARGISTLRSA